VRQEFRKFLEGTDELKRQGIAAAATEADRIRKMGTEEVRRLQSQLTRIRSALTALSSAQRALPACLQEAEAGKEYLAWDPGQGECQPGRMLGRPNPRVYAATPSPVDVETILISTVTGRTVGVAAESHEYKNRILQNLDLAGLIRTLTR
jgi:hypothetical protein